jgi:hypothetical protein
MVFDRRTSDNYPLVIRARVNNAEVNKRTKTGIVTIVHCDAEIASVNDWGMPPHTEDFDKVEDGLHRELGAFDIGAFHVANVTGDGQRRLIFAHASPLDFGPVLNLFNISGFTLRASKPEDRQDLIDLITPSAVDRQLNGDLGVISNLQKNGDDGEAPRKTDFWFYGPRPDLERLNAELAPQGYKVDHWLDEPLGVVLTRSMPVDFDTFREVTPVLVAAADKHGVTYDGWETFVIQPTPEASPAQVTQSKSLLSRFFGAKKS